MQGIAHIRALKYYQLLPCFWKIITCGKLSPDTESKIVGYEYANVVQVKSASMWNECTWEVSMGETIRRERKANFKA